ncbi:hypothetical protein FO440_23490 [Mucilaginibacter corticis]|uniref:Uncharacterized protein n=1 Tax=Mucilaginibacter corticis TaxID=2597670 RepID=A0A556M7K2_9SPHI|nr:hypothetical protein [Mucilaginibacter corticis]TSJ35888.1 hypothetical protein FO440_23490 [Mucilaginibacter corticis]
MEYYVNKHAQTNGYHEVHTKHCPYFPINREYLGDYPSCKPAVDEAKKTFPTADGCKTCSPSCHTW